MGAPRWAHQARHLPFTAGRLHGRSSSFEGNHCLIGVKEDVTDRSIWWIPTRGLTHLRVYPVVSRFVADMVLSLSSLPIWVCSFQSTWCATPMSSVRIRVNKTPCSVTAVAEYGFVSSLLCGGQICSWTTATASTSYLWVLSSPGICCTNGFNAFLCIQAEYLSLYRFSPPNLSRSLPGSLLTLLAHPGLFLGRLHT